MREDKLFSTYIPFDCLGELEPFFARAEEVASRGGPKGMIVAQVFREGLQVAFVEEPEKAELLRATLKGYGKSADAPDLLQ